MIQRAKFLGILFFGALQSAERDLIDCDALAQKIIQEAREADQTQLVGPGSVERTGFTLTVKPHVTLKYDPDKWKAFCEKYADYMHKLEQCKDTCSGKIALSALRRFRALHDVVAYDIQKNEKNSSSSAAE